MAPLNTRPTCPSLETMGWRPAELKSKIDRLLCPSVAPGHCSNTSPSGPRRRRDVIMICTIVRLRSLSKSPITPAMPHILHLLPHSPGKVRNSKLDFNVSSHISRQLEPELSGGRRLSIQSTYSIPDIQTVQIN